MSAMPTKRVSVTLDGKGIPHDNIEFMSNAKILLWRHCEFPARTESVSIEGELYIVRDIETKTTENQSVTTIVRLAKAA